MGFLEVPVQTNNKGQVRKVGFELEFTGIDLDVVASVVMDQFGGTHTCLRPFHHEVRDTALGTFVLELDMPLVKNEKYRTHLAALGIELEDDSAHTLERLLGSAFSTVVPYEVVMPPVRLTELDVVETFGAHLAEAGACGTGASVAYAFGLHINAELPSDDTHTILAHFKAFLLLEDWIRRAGETDWTRRLTPFVNSFPKVYVNRVLDPGYEPDFGQFMADYVADNNTRHRALDLMPIFAWKDREALCRFTDLGHEIGARPTFHYRLPNCLIGDPNWRIAGEWAYWVWIERLAHAQETLMRLSQLFLAGDVAGFDTYRKEFIDDYA